MLNRILVALKFTPAGAQALRKAIELAESQGSELFVFHALDYTLQQLHPTDPKITELIRQAKENAERLIGPLAAEGPKFAFTCHPADPALGTCKEAAAIGAHMIVLGAHKDSQKRSLGRVDYIGQTILEKAPCPVMLVPHPAG